MADKDNYTDKELATDGRQVTRVATQKTYSCHCLDREAGVWGVIADHQGGRIVMSVYPEDGVLTQMRAGFIALTLTDLERGRA